MSVYSSENKNIIAVAEELVNRRYAKSLAEIARICGKTTQYFTDLKSGRAKYSLSFLDVLVDKYPVNKNFVLTGEGSMLRDDQKSSLVLSAEELWELVKSQQRTIENLTNK